MKKYYLPAWTNNLTDPGLPPHAAEWSGVSPSLFYDIYL